MTILLIGGTVVRSLQPMVVESADLAIEDGRVVPAEAVPSGTARLDCTGCLIVPGNVCAHTHLYSALSRGMPYDLAPPRTFVEILQRVCGASTGRLTRPRSGRPRWPAGWRRCWPGRRP